MPILSDAPVSDPIDIGSDEIDRLALASDLPKGARKMTAET